MRLKELDQLTPKQLASEKEFRIFFEQTMKTLCEIGNESIRQNTDKYLSQGIDPESLTKHSYGAK